MSKLKHSASIPHTDTTIAELRTDPVFAVEYLTLAMEQRDNPEHRAVGLLALRDVAEAYGGECHSPPNTGYLTSHADDAIKC